MKYIIAVIQPDRLDLVLDLLEKREIHLVTVTSVMGRGRQKGIAGVYRGHKEVGSLLKKVKLEIAVNEEFVKPAVEAILKAAKKDVADILGGYGFLEGETADLEVALQSRKTINEKMLLALGLTQAQIDACKVEGEAYKVFRVKAKKVRKAA